MFFRRKEKRDEEIDKIKEAMKENEEIPRSIVSERYPIAEEFHPQPQPVSAPLFVKVEKYRDVLLTIQEMKVFVSGVKQLFTVLSEAENVKNDALKIMRTTIQRLEKNLIEIDTELLRPRGIDLGELTQGEVEIRQIEDSLNDLQKQLAALRGELQDLK